MATSGDTLNCEECDYYDKDEGTAVPSSATGLIVHRYRVKRASDRSLF